LVSVFHTTYGVIEGIAGVVSLNGIYLFPGGICKFFGVVGFVGIAALLENILIKFGAMISTFSSCKWFVWYTDYLWGCVLVCFFLVCQRQGCGLFAMGVHLLRKFVS